MNTKRALTLAALAAFAVLATSAAHATSSNSNNITVEWNTQAIGKIVLVTNYTAAGADGNLTAPTIFQALNGGTTNSCTTTGYTGMAAATVDYDAVTPDAVDATDCLYLNAINAKVTTSDSSGYTVVPSATVPANFLLCLLPNGTWANNLAVTQSTRAAAVAGITTTATTCTGAPGNGYNLGSAATMFTSAAQTAATNLGGDLELVLGPNAPSGLTTLTVFYTLNLS